LSSLAERIGSGDSPILFNTKPARGLFSSATDSHYKYKKIIRKLGGFTGVWFGWSRKGVKVGSESAFDKVEMGMIGVLRQS
jgi:hypothetical protein